MTDNYDSGFDLVLSDNERQELMQYYTDECLPDYQTWGDGDMWYGLQVGDRMFDINIWHDEDSNELISTAYECDWDGTQNNWKTNCRHSCTLGRHPVTQRNKT